LGIFVLAAAPLFAVRPLSRALTAPFASRAAGRLGSMASLVPVIDHRPAQPSEQTDVEPVPAAAENDEPAAAGRSHRHKKSHHVHVPRAAVVRALARGSNPSARIVGQTDDHPGGILILNVGALKGILCPGDVITDVGGVPAASEQAVLSVVAGAQQTEAKVVSGRIWRHGEYLTATAETPWSCSGCTPQNWQRP
jgi:S1-C subfamily serine protease